MNTHTRMPSMWYKWFHWTMSFIKFAADWWQSLAAAVVVKCHAYWSVMCLLSKIRTHLPARGVRALVRAYHHRHRHHHYHHRHRRYHTTLWSHSVPDRIIYIELVRLRLKVFPELDAMNRTWRVHHMPNGSFLTLKLWQFICVEPTTFEKAPPTMTTEEGESEKKTWNRLEWPARIFQYREMGKPQKINSAFEWIFRRKQYSLYQPLGSIMEKLIV